MRARARTLGCTCVHIIYIERVQKNYLQSASCNTALYILVTCWVYRQNIALSLHKYIVLDNRRNTVHTVYARDCVCLHTTNHISVYLLFLETNVNLNHMTNILTKLYKQSFLVMVTYFTRFHQLVK